MENIIYAGTYHNFDYDRQFVNIDFLLQQYEKDRLAVTEMARHNPRDLIEIIWKPNGPLALDNECRCKIAVENIRTPFSCFQCKNLRRLIDFKLGGINRSFHIEWGNSVGKSFKISSYGIVAPFLEWDEKTTWKANNYLQQNIDHRSCGTPDISSLKCITGDSFSIGIVVRWGIEKIFAERGLPHIKTVHTAFICNNQGVYLEDVSNVEILKNILVSRETNGPMLTRASAKRSRVPLTKSIITQLLVILQELSKVDFSHGNPGINSLIFSKEPVSYKYEMFHVEGPITLCITDLWQSSATFGNFHYSCKTVESSFFLERNVFVPQFSTKSVSVGDFSRNVNFYKLNQNSLQIYSALRHLGLPLYVGSFDFYCFMVSLMTTKFFYDAVLFDSQLRELWSLMWLKDDLQVIEERIINSQINPKSPVDLVVGLWLRCDIVPFLWDVVKRGQ